MVSGGVAHSSIDAVYRPRAQSFVTWLPKSFLNELQAIDTLYKEMTVWYHFASLVRHCMFEKGVEYRHQLSFLVETSKDHARFLTNADTHIDSDDTEEDDM